MKLVLGCLSLMLISVLPSSLCLKCFTNSNKTQQNATDKLNITEVNDDKCCGMSIQEPCEPKSLMFHTIGPDPEVQKSKEFFCTAEPTATCCCMEDLCNGNFTSFMKMWNETVKESTNQSQCVLQAIAAFQQNISEISSELRRKSTTEPPPDGTVFPIRERPTKQKESDTVQKPEKSQNTKMDKGVIIYLSLATGLLLLCVIFVCCATLLRKRRQKRRPKVPKFARKSNENAESKNGKAARPKKRRASAESRSKETRSKESKESKEKSSNDGKLDSEYFGIPQAQQGGGSIESQMQAPMAEGESVFIPGARGGKG